MKKYFFIQSVGEITIIILGHRGLCKTEGLNDFFSFYFQTIIFLQYQWRWWCIWKCCFSYEEEGQKLRNVYFWQIFEKRSFHSLVGSTLKSLKNFNRTQNYDSLTKRLLMEPGKLFEDAVFPANSSVLTDNVEPETYIVRPFGQKKKSGIEWLRPHVSFFYNDFLSGKFDSKPPQPDIQTAKISVTHAHTNNQYVPLHKAWRCYAKPRTFKLY